MTESKIVRYNRNAKFDPSFVIFFGTPTSRILSGTPKDWIELYKSLFLK